ncbi:hypothetical protein [Bacillus cereus]|uniref:hypothetical protein n=1 Tax=Bacillus cereus group TaxID=86661 RepID=UPI000D024325|nr:hypothetical protein [Bacillus cereus]MBR9655332.1 hypothetical protein [Bacillus cereus]
MGRVKIYQRLLEYIDHNSKYIGDYWNISITTQNISAIIEIYRPQLKIYQRLLEYIDLPTKTDNGKRRGYANILAHPRFS